MLSLLRISNYAIIDDLEIELGAGFTVMTGETGAGKSILVDAVGLALGDRSDAGAVRSGAKRADISLVFELGDGHPAQDWLRERGLDDEELCCLRRTIAAEGGSRAFINNRPVTLKDLRTLGSLLVDIHGQHAHQSLLTARAQRALLDAHGGHGELTHAVAGAFLDWQEAARELERRAGASADREAQLDLLRFQLGEVEALDLGPGELEALRRESERLQHIDTLRQAIGEAAGCLYESDSGSAYELVHQARRAIEPVVRHDAELAGSLERILAVEIELREAGGDLARRLEDLEADPARLDAVEARLHRAQQIARRHRIDEAEVPELAARLRNEIEALDSSAASIEKLRARHTEAHDRYRKHAARLSRARSSAGAKLSAAVSDRLRELGLPNAEFRVEITPRPESRHDSTGTDQIAFLVTTNPGSPPGPIERVASGGELSRVGLALAVVATDPSSIPTLIFDEVDAGIGGAVAEVVGRRLREIASRHQVLCVTHLPQVASQGEHHYRIVKLTDGQSSRTQVRELDAPQRIDELSRMLGGVEITAATRAHAEEMIRQSAGS